MRLIPKAISIWVWLSISKSKYDFAARFFFESLWSLIQKTKQRVISEL